MAIDKEWYSKKFDELLNQKVPGKFFIKKSSAGFKIKLYRDKGEKSFMLAAFLRKASKDNVALEETNLPSELFLNYWIITIDYYSMLYLAKALILTSLIKSLRKSI